MEPYAMIRVSILLLQQHRTVVENFIPSKFGVFRCNPWQPLGTCGTLMFRRTRLENTVLVYLSDKIDLIFFSHSKKF